MQTKMETQVLSIEQMLVLKDLGIDMSKASMYWCSAYNGHALCQNDMGTKNTIPTFTLQDILDMLPKVFNGIPLTMTLYSDGIYHIGYKGFCGFRSENLLQATYQTLLWCIANDLIKTEKL